MKIILANPRGFCAGVNMAIESLDRALAQCAAAGLWTEERATAWWKDKANGTTLPQNTQPTVAAPALTA